MWYVVQYVTQIGMMIFSLNSIHFDPYCSNNIMFTNPNKKILVAFRSKSELKLPKGPSIQHRQQIAKSYKLTLSNVGVMDSLRHHRANSQTKLTNALHPQLHKKTIENVYRVNKSRSLKQILQAKLRTQEQRINDMKIKEEARSKEIEKMRKLQTRQRQRNQRKKLRESQRQQQIQRSWRQKTQQRQRSQSSFLQTTRRQSLNMLKRSKQHQSRSQQSLIDEQLRETVRSSQYEQQRKNLEKRKQQYEHQYRKAFLKNTSPPKQDLPETVMYSTLKEKAQKLTEIYSLPQHLPTIARKTASQASKHPSKQSVGNLQQELMISSMKPAVPKTIKSKSLNPETPTPPLQAKPIPHLQPLSSPTPSTPPIQNDN